MQPEQRSALSTCAKIMQGYDQLHLLSVLGAMQLIPDNIHLTASLETLARVAVTLPSTTRGKHSIKRHQVVTLLARFPRHFYNQPTLGAFTEAVAFFGGTYTIFAATTDDLGVVLRQTLAALFLDVEPLDDREFLLRARDLLWAALLLSDEVARRAGVRRNMPPPPETREKRLVFPDDASLRDAVVFTEEDLRILLAAADLKPNVLEGITMSQGQDSLAAMANDQGGLYLRPLVRVGDKRVVALPGQLLNAARHYLQRQAIERGHRGRLASLLHRAATESVRQAVARLGASEVDLVFQDPLPSELCSELVFRIDTDKMLYVLLATDTLQGFDSTKPFTDWTLAVTARQIAERMEAAVSHICQADPLLNDVLCLLVLQGPMGSSDQSYWSSLPRFMPGLVLSTHELETISWLEREEPLILWQFVYTAAHLRERGPVHHQFFLDEWAISRLAEHGDYAPLGSFSKPILMSPGAGARLRGEILEQWDFHGATFEEAGSGVEVVRAGPKDSRIYTICGSPLPVTRLVEGLPVPIWIVGVMYGNEWDEKLHDLYHAVTGAIAFWVEALEPGLKPALSSMSSYLTQVVIRVVLVPQDDWFAQLGTTPGQAPMRVDVKVEHGVLDLTLWPDARILFFGPDNEGERLLLSSLLGGVCQLLPEGQRECLSPTVIRELLDRHAPQGPKKAVSFYSYMKAPNLDPRDIPPYRGVKRRAELNVKAEIGRHTIGVLGLRPGVVPADQREWLFGQIVAFLFQQLEREVATLSPDGLLEWLMEQYESIIRQKEQTAWFAPSRLATVRDPAREETMIHEEISTQALASVASRFLIEYVAARPPQGFRLISYSAYDHLLALVAQIFEWGGNGDLQRFGLAAPELVVYPFGRVDVRTDDFDQMRQRYFAVFAGHAVQKMGETFAELWAPPAEIDFDPNMPPFVEEVGEQLADWFLLMGRMLPIGDEISMGVVSMPLDDLVHALQRELGWQEGRIRQRIAELSLAPRASFLEPDGYRRDQVYPWRFHRALSYLRRPLVQRVRRGVTEVMWGSRHITALVPYLWTSFRTQRLKDVDQQTIRLMGKAADKAGLEFNIEVERFFAQYPHLMVVRGFKKVKGLNMSNEAGDVDVLVIDPAGQQIMVVECKQLARADSAQELRWELDALYSGDNSRVGKHLKRIRWLEQHWQQVLAQLGLDPTVKWNLVPLMVVDEELFAPHYQQPPFPVVAMRDLPDWLAGKGNER